MRYNITITRKALKQVMKIQAQDRPRIFAGIRNLADSETWGDVRKLTNHPYGYRLRIGPLPGAFLRHRGYDPRSQRNFR